MKSFFINPSFVRYFFRYSIIVRYSIIAAIFVSFMVFGRVASPLLAQNAQNTQAEDSPFDYVCTRLVAVTSTSTFVCDLIKVYPSTRLDPLLSEKIPIEIAGIVAADLESSNKKEKMLAMETLQFLEEELREAKRITLKNPTRDEAFQIRADIYVDGRSLSRLLLRTKLVCEAGVIPMDKKGQQSLKKYIKKICLICPPQ